MPVARKPDTTAAQPPMQDAKRLCCSLAVRLGAIWALDTAPPFTPSGARILASQVLTLHPVLVLFLQRGCTSDGLSLCSSFRIRPDIAQ